MGTQIRLGAIEVEVAFKDIKNVHLSVHPPAGRVSISAPARMSLDTIRAFAISELPWVRQQQNRLCEQEREPPREYLDRESHYVWGKRYLLSVSESDRPHSVEITPKKLVPRVRPGTGEEKRRAVLEGWYRDNVKTAVPELIAKWEPLLGVKVKRFFVQRMKTRWGSCNPCTRSIRFNTDLAKKPRAGLEYIIVHEMVHLLESTHNARFVALMDRFMPLWQSHREALNSLPLRHESWKY